MRKDKGTRNEEQEGEEELRRRKADDGEDSMGAGAQGAGMANAKVKNRHFPLLSDL
jgi:hypothetical protein